MKLGEQLAELCHVQWFRLAEYLFFKGDIRDSATKKLIEEILCTLIAVIFSFGIVGIIVLVSKMFQNIYLFYLIG